MTFAVYRNQDFYAYAHNTVSIVDGLHSFYRGMKNIFVNAIILTILFVFVLFVMLFINPLLLFLVRLLKSTKPVVNTDFEDSENYRTLRLKYDKLSKDLEVLKKETNVAISKRSWLFRPYFKLTLECQKVLQSHHEELKMALEKLNSRTEIENFEVLTEEELWNERPKSYKYMV